MKRSISLLALTFSLVLPLAAHAGSQTIDCVSRSKTIMMSAGNSESSGVKIQYVDKNGKQAEFRAELNLMPAFAGNADTRKPYLIAVPTSEQKLLSQKNEVMHVFHKNGTQCYGRERWDNRYTQSYVLTGKEGGTASSILPAHNQMPGLTHDGYLVGEFSCRDYGITSAGGCFVEEGDKMVWEKDNTQDNN